MSAARVQEPISLNAPGVSPARKKPMQLIADDRRTYARLPISATVRLKRVGGRPEPRISDCTGMDISCSGIRFQFHRSLAPGTAVDLEIILLPKPTDGRAVKMFTAATVVRSHAADGAGWHDVAVAFDDIAISREAVR
jgi:hypothetical protein